MERELSPHFKTRTAANGKDALRVLEEEEISLVVSDVMMPEMNGFELCRMIKSQLPFSHIPVIFIDRLDPMSANGFRDYRRSGRLYTEAFHTGT